ncbi:MAG: DDE-type integrase/transposase/recombinase [Anaerolineales bacterium]
MVSRDRLERGELKRLIRELASRDYDIPGSARRDIGEKTIEAWFYAWRRGGIDALTPKPRSDRGQSRLPIEVQDAILDAKRDKPRRSIDQLIVLLEKSCQAPRGTIPRSSVHRLLQRHGLSRPSGGASVPEEHRSYEALYAGDIWYGDVMHGPRVPVHGRMRKVYLVSLMDDASRLLTHSAFCTGEKALDIEGVLKQAVLKRGLPVKLVVDNGSAYRARTLQGICARLGIHLIYCRPYAPEGKGKLERWHRTVRDQFLGELDLTRIQDLSDLNARLWAWIEEIYHRRTHAGLQALSPLQRYQQDLVRIRTLGHRAAQLDQLFYHRLSRKVRKDATVSYQGQRFEAPYELAGKTLQLVVDPHSQQAIWLEDDEGKIQGEVVPLDVIANSHRRRHKPDSQVANSHQSQGPNLVEIAYQQYHAIDGDLTTSEKSSQTTQTKKEES